MIASLGMYDFGAAVGANDRLWAAIRDRLRAAGHSLTLAPGTFLATDDLAELQTKLAHTLFHAHLTAVFAWAEHLGADPAAA